MQDEATQNHVHVSLQSQVKKGRRTNKKQAQAKPKHTHTHTHIHTHTQKLSAHHQAANVPSPSPALVDSRSYPVELDVIRLLHDVEIRAPDTAHLMPVKIKGSGREEPSRAQARMSE